MRFPSTVLTLLFIAARASAQDSSLTGLWASKRWFGPEVRGELRLQRVGGDWRSRVGSRDASVHFSRDSVRVDVPGGGTFTGRLSTKGDSVIGQWVQAPAYNFGRYTSPLVLTRCGADCFRATVVPLEDTFTFFMNVTRRADGTLGAFLRNPERNQGVFLRANSMARRGDTIELRNSRGQIIETGVMRDDQVILRLRSATHDFQRVPADSASDFYPKARPRVSYAYSPPVPRNDGWDVADVAAVGMSREKLEQMINVVANNTTDSTNAHRPHALLVARRGKLVLEEYFHGNDAETRHDSRSASKTFTTIVLGAAMQSGFKVGPSTPVYSTFGVPSNTLDARKRALTLQHLLTMSSGFDCDDDSPTPHPGSEDALTGQDTNPDWTRMVLGLNMIRDPGAQAVYCSINAYLAGQVIAKATGRPFAELAWDLVGAPLQMQRYYVWLDPLGNAYMGGGVRFTGRDFLKLAQLYLNGGMWNNRRILSEAWVRESTERRYPMGTNGYGYLWYDVRYPRGDNPIRAYAAFGNGGQFWMYIPEYSLAIAGFGGNYADRAAVLTANELVPKYIIPAIVPGK